MAKALLEVGQKVFIEVNQMYGGSKRSLREMTILEANKTTAYAWEDDSTTTRIRINQKTHMAKYPVPTGSSYRLWLSEEDYENHYLKQAERSALIKEATAKMASMSNEELKTFLETK